MRLTITLIVMVCFLVPLSLIAGEPGKLREIDTKDLKIDFEKGKVTTPKVIASVEEFDKAAPNADAIKKQLDFTKDKVLLFAWGGSGGDKLSASASEDGKLVTLTFAPGRTRDFRRHVHLFALPKNAEYKIVNAPGGK